MFTEDEIVTGECVRACLCECILYTGPDWLAVVQRDQYL